RRVARRAERTAAAGPAGDTRGDRGGGRLPRLRCSELRDGERLRDRRRTHGGLVPLPAIQNGCAGKAGTTSCCRRRKRRLGAGFWPAITRRQSPPSPLARLFSLAAVECGLWLCAGDPE